VGDEVDVRRLADALGFRYEYEPRTKQYAHPAVVFVLTPDGTISRYLHGLEVPALDYRMALVEAGRGQIGSFIEQVLVTCYRYDPAERRYGFYVLGFLRLGGIVILATIVGLFVTMWRHESKRAQADRFARENERGGPT
jgi:protein SCO1/2